MSARAPSPSAQSGLSAWGRTLCLMNLGLQLCACKPPPKTEPSTAALERLLYALRGADLQRLWSGLTSESRAWLCEKAGLTPSADRLQRAQAPKGLINALSLQPDWRFEHSWGEALKASPPAQTQKGGQWFTFTDHGHIWRVQGAQRDGVWRFDLFHADRL